VYADCFYGTLKSEVERITSKGKNVIFDVDVVGGMNIKKQYGEQALSIFISPPSIEELRDRLQKRNTDSPEMIEKRVAKAAFEMSFATQFDITIINDNLEKALADTEKVLIDFLQ
jgi:guanylate kinase